MKRPALWLALALFLFTAALLVYRVGWLGYPPWPTAPGKTWQFTVRMSLEPGKGEAQVVLGLPSENAGRMLMEERFVSGLLTVGVRREGPNRIGVWSGRLEGEREEISYRATIVVQPGRGGRQEPPGPDPLPPGGGGGEADLAKRLAGRWKSLPPADRIRAVAATARGEWKSPPPEQKDLEEWKAVAGRMAREEALLLLLHAASLPARRVEGLLLAEGIQNQPLSRVEAWNGRTWEMIVPERGEVESGPLPFLPLAYGGEGAFRASGVESAEVRWALSRQVVSGWNLHFERVRRSNRFLDRWSLFHLPADFQGTFRLLLLVPIGALIIGLLRNLIGFPTFGIFMPVLMALAFRSTGLSYGLGIFAGLLLLGYAVRRGIDGLRLLLVPRMAVILTLVIACFTFLALLGNRLGLREFMAVGLLPFVILTMVIERFFILVEEAGGRAGLKTAAGSAAVAVISYGIISWEPLQLTFFVYPELLAAVAGVQILLGRYTGFRLSELFRFRALGGPP